MIYPSPSLSEAETRTDENMPVIFLNDPVRRGGLSVPPDLADESYLPLNPAASC
jgi:hypothetical protein